MHYSTYFLIHAFTVRYRSYLHYELCGIHKYAVALQPVTNLLSRKQDIYNYVYIHTQSDVMREESRNATVQMPDVTQFGVDVNIKKIVYVHVRKSIL